MTREFVMMPEFDRQWKDMGLDDEELSELQEVLLKNPKARKVIRGTKGLRNEVAKIVVRLKQGFKKSGRSK